MTAWIAGLLYQLGNLAMALVLAAFLALGTRAAILVVLDRNRGALAFVLRVAAAVTFLALGLLYAFFTAHVLEWSWRAVLVALGTAALILLTVRLPPPATGRRPVLPSRPGVWPALAQTVGLLALLLMATVTLMWSGFLALTTDRPVLLVDVTGETRVQRVRWGPPDQPAREEDLTTHRVVFKTPEGEPVSEAWIYGDQVGVKGRVLRLSPALNAAGVPNLYELQFAHNGYDTAQRHNGFPHHAVALPPMGPLKVHSWWRPLQSRLLARWESGAATESDWAVRSMTVESTYYPLRDAQGRPITQVYRLVLTPGGLSSS